MKSFVGSPVPKLEAIPFELEGKPYFFQPGKKSGAMIALLMASGGSFADANRVRALLDWLGNGLNRYDKQKSMPGKYVEDEQGLGPQAKALLADLHKDDDEDDKLELDTVLDAVNWLVSEVSGRPTG